MMAITARLPVRVQVGDGAPVEVGTWEVDVTEPVPDRAAFAELLRQVADEIAARPDERSSRKTVTLNVRPDDSLLRDEVRRMIRKG